MSPKAKPAEVARRIRRRTSLRPELALVLGSGFHGVLPQIEPDQELDYRRLPGFAVPGVGGHSGRLILGRLNGVPILVLSGRAHYYEGYSLEEVTFPMRVVAEAGVKSVLLTNAAGGINRRLRPGQFMAIKDHLNLMGVNPLRGVIPLGRTRFVDLTTVYDERLRRLMRKAAQRVGLKLVAGVYAAVSGPSYETPAEIRAFAGLGADAVGMSTVPEAVVARQCGLEVAGLSCITNWGAGLGPKALSHEEVLRMGGRVERTAAELLWNFVTLYGRGR